MPFQGFLLPTVSLDRQWVAHWSLMDSTVAGEGVVQFLQLRLRDRARDTDTLLLTTRNTDGVTTTASETFDPDSCFLAYCTTFTSLRIHELATGRRVKDLTVPYCYALSWSWGPEGKPIDTDGPLAELTAKSVPIGALLARAVPITGRGRSAPRQSESEN